MHAHAFVRRGTEFCSDIVFGEFGSRIRLSLIVERRRSARARERGLLYRSKRGTISTASKASASTSSASGERHVQAAQQERERTTNHSTNHSTNQEWRTGGAAKRGVHHRDVWSSCGCGGGACAPPRGWRPASRNARRSRNSICPLRLRRSSVAQRCTALSSSGSTRNRNDRRDVTTARSGAVHCKLAPSAREAPGNGRRASRVTPH